MLPVMRFAAPSILIVDDDPDVRRRIRDVVSDALTLPDLRISEAGSGAECLAAVDGATWDVVLLDIGMPDSRGLDLLKLVKLARPALRVVMVSGLPADQYAAPAVRAGAEAYVEKGRVLEDLVPLVRTLFETHTRGHA